MTKLLDEAIERARALPEADQDQVAEVLMAVVQKSRAACRLTEEQAETVRRTQDAVRQGAIASDDDMDALWRRFGLA